MEKILQRTTSVRAEHIPTAPRCPYQEDGPPRLIPGCKTFLESCGRYSGPLIAERESPIDQSHPVQDHSSVYEHTIFRVSLCLRDSRQGQEQSDQDAKMNLSSVIKFMVQQKRNEYTQ